MTTHWIKALVVSSIVSAVVTLGSSILLSTGASYLPTVEWDRVEKMTYRQATNYLLERSKHESGWDLFLQGFGHPRYWIDLLQAWGIAFGFAFVCCAALLLWLRGAGTPSNGTVERDARNSGER
jgi:hypothetical protein